MLELLRDPAWQGVSGIIAIVSLILYIIAEKVKFKIPTPSTKIWSLFKSSLILFFAGAICILLGALAIATADAFISRYGSFYGGLFTHIAMGAALGCWFMFLNFTVIEELYYDVKLSSLLILISMILLGAGYGLMNTTTDSNRLVMEIFYYGLGTWGGGSIIVSIIKLDLDQKKKQSKQNNNV